MVPPMCIVLREAVKPKPVPVIVTAPPVVGALLIAEIAGGKYEKDGSSRPTSLFDLCSFATLSPLGRIT